MQHPSRIRHDVSMQEIRGLYCNKSVSTPRQLRMPDLAQKITSMTSRTARAKQQVKIIKRASSSAKHNEIRNHLRHGAVVTCVHFFSATLKSHVIASFQFCFCCCALIFVRFCLFFLHNPFLFNYGKRYCELSIVQIYHRMNE